MTALDYSVNFPYGATSPPYGTVAFPFHKGNDRPCPTGTPIVINGTTVALTGNTGMASGPHLHIQEWQGNTANVRKPQNEFKPGAVIQVDSTGGTTFGKYITIKNADGWNDSYCHLSQINVKVGDRIGEDMPTRQDIQSLWEMILERYPTEEEFSFWTTKTTSQLVDALLNGADRKNKRKSDVNWAYKLGWNRNPEQKEYDFWTFRNISTLMDAIYKDPTSAVNQGVKPTELKKGIYEVK